MKFTYSKRRHGGWYVHEVIYPSGAIGCVSNKYPDRKWRIAFNTTVTRVEDKPTFKTREEAAKAEYEMVKIIYTEGFSMARTELAKAQS